MVKKNKPDVIPEQKPTPNQPEQVTQQAKPGKTVDPQAQLMDQVNSLKRPFQQLTGEYNARLLDEFNRIVNQLVNGLLQTEQQRDQYAKMYTDLKNKYEPAKKA